jgi:hypothetical protein
MVVVVEAGLRGHQEKVVVRKFEYVLKMNTLHFTPSFTPPPFLLLSPLAGRSRRSNRRHFTFLTHFSF